MWDIAPQFNAMLVFSEHRYYGTSLPFGDQSFTKENVVYLSVEQALADHAVLIDHIKSNTSGANTSSVIAFGGSYGGMLAAWIRMKYPNMVNGSIAASAPIWLFGDLTPCELPYKVLTSAFEMGGTYCPLNIRMSWDALEEIDKGSTDDKQWLHNTFKVCGNMKHTIATDLSDWLQSIWFNMAMVNYPYPASFLEPLPAWPVKAACEILNEKIFQSHKELLTAIAEASSIYYNYAGQAKCLNVSQTAVSSLGNDAWNFQACTEMVLPTCTNGIDDMYPPNPWNIEEYTEYCRASTGMMVTPNPNWAITQFGGKDITSYSNILFSNGELDPWSAGGVLHTVKASLPAVVIPNAAHHLDLRAKNDGDTRDVERARQAEIDFITKLL